EQHYGRVWYFRDVTVTRKTEQALRESEARNRALINSIPDLLFRVRSDGTFIDYQGAADYTPAVEPERFLGRHVSEIFDEETAHRFMQKIHAALETNELQLHEYEMPMLDGTLRNWEQRIVVSGGDELLLIVRDISARKQAEEALRTAHAELEQRVNERTAELQQINRQLQQEVEERTRVEEALRSSEERLELALLGAELGLIDMDLQTGKAVYNERWAEIRGYPLDQYFDTMLTWKDSIHPDDRPVVTYALENHLSGQTPFFEHEYRVKRGDGTWRWVRCRGKIVNRDVRGLPLRFSGTQTDITEYKQLEQQLLHVQKMDAVGRLAGGVAHDFNNILTVIMSYSELVLLQVKQDPRLRARVEEIKKAAEKATRLTRQLLMFSRSESVAPRLLDMNRLILDIESMLERLIGEHIELTIHLDPTISAIKADAGQLEQVLLNLVVNSRDAMPEGGTVDVTTRRIVFGHRKRLPHPEMQPGTYVELSVCDTGCGMSQEIQKRIFEPFFTTKGPGKGTGLGLSTVFGIVKQNRGFIDVKSEVGEGTTFRIFFPAATNANLVSPLPSSTLPTHDTGVETVLLVEDEDQIRELICSALEHIGYTVLSASTGEEALARSKQHNGPIHLMITDVIMPGISGLKLAQQLLAQRPATKVLFISGYTDGEINMRKTMDDHRAFLRKPFTPAILANTVRDLLDRAPTEP
ncbi:MAG: PAS domain-containing protein, partial [Caldilineaceae bacterium]|nr:PAS domain-containing protein [Caldilineaceae bacterium]